MNTPMQKVLGSHTVKGKTMAVLECGHEVAYDAVKWGIPAGGGVPEGMAECSLSHDTRPSDQPAIGPPPYSGPQSS